MKSCLLEGLLRIDEEGRRICRSLLADSDTTESHLIHAFKTIQQARREGEEWFDSIGDVDLGPDANEAVLANFYFLETLQCMAGEHTKRTGDLLVGRVVEGRLPEELLEMIREYYIEDEEDVEEDDSDLDGSETG